MKSSERTQAVDLLMREAPLALGCNLSLGSQRLLVASDGLHMLLRRAQPRVHRVDGDVRRSERAPRFGLRYPLLRWSPTHVRACLYPYQLRIPVCLFNVIPQSLNGLAHAVAWRPQREPAVCHVSGPAQPYVRPSTPVWDAAQARG